MTVDQILAGKGRDVETIEPSRSLMEAARILSGRRIGALVVTEAGGEIAGVLSERDIVRAVAGGGHSALEEPVSRHMTAKVVTCTGRSSVNDLMELMTRHRFRHVPVLAEGRLDGIVSIGDVVKHRVAEIEAESAALREYIATA